MATEFVPLPQNVIKPGEEGASADHPMLHELGGEVIVVRALEWIGATAPYKGVRLCVHIVKGEQMTKQPAWYRAYTSAVLRVAHALVGSDSSRRVELERWPMYKVVASNGSYSLSDV